MLLNCFCYCMDNNDKHFKFWFETIGCINWIAIEFNIFISLECTNLPDQTDHKKLLLFHNLLSMKWKECVSRKMGGKSAQMEKWPSKFGSEKISHNHCSTCVLQFLFHARPTQKKKGLFIVYYQIQLYVITLKSTCNLIKYFTKFINFFLFILKIKLFVVGTPRKRCRAVDEEAVKIPLAKG